MNALKITEAVSFLQHPDVQPMSEEAKREFLRTKGLSPEEIEQAYIEFQNQELARQSGFWSLRNVVAVGTGAYIAYRAVTGLLGWLTAEESERQQRADLEAAARRGAEGGEEGRRLRKAEEVAEELRARLAAQEAEMAALRGEVAAVLAMRTTLAEMKTQLDGLKKSVLSKNSFPTPSYLRPPPDSNGSGVPSWQLNQRGPETEKDVSASDASEAPSQDPTTASPSTSTSAAANGNGTRGGNEDVD